jgi:hypothetical protein
MKDRDKCIWCQINTISIFWGINELKCVHYSWYVMTIQRKTSKKFSVLAIKFCRTVHIFRERQKWEIDGLRLEN